MMFASARPLGHFALPQAKLAAASLAALQPELARQKCSGPMAEPYLDVLNRLIEPLAIVQGLAGLRTWLAEVQAFVVLLKQRSFAGAPL